MSGGGGQKQTTSTSTEPPTWARPYIQGTGGHIGILPQAEQQFLSEKPQYCPTSTVAPWSPEQTAAAQMGVARATHGSPLDTAAGAEALKTLGGDYLSAGNPYLENIRSLGER